MTNKEKFLKLVSKEPNDALKKSKERIRQRAWKKESQKIAIKILSRLDELAWTQKKLAETMDVSPQYISKLVKGRENLTLETMIKLQRILEIPILASFATPKTSGFIEATKGFKFSGNLEISVERIPRNMPAFITAKTMGSAKILNLGTAPTEDTFLLLNCN